MIRMQVFSLLFWKYRIGYDWYDDIYMARLTLWYSAIIWEQNQWLLRQISILIVYRVNLVVAPEVKGLITACGYVFTLLLFLRHQR